MNEDYIKELEKRVDKLEEYVKKHTANQITYPLDEVSKSVLVQSKIATTTLTSSGSGSAGTQDISLTGLPQTITVPAQPSGTVKVVIDGTVVDLLKK